MPRPREMQFAFRVTGEERRLIKTLADHLQRTQSDAVRFVVISAVRELQKQQASQNGPEQKQET